MHYYRAGCNLNPSLLRGQVYDENMSGQYKGCAAILQKKNYPKAVYSHCCSEVLNLAVINTCDAVKSFCSDC